MKFTKHAILLLGLLLLLLPVVSQAQTSTGPNLSCNSLEKKMWQAEQACINTLNMANKKLLLNQELLYQKQADFLGCDNLIEIMECLCGGVLDNSDTYIKITTPSQNVKMGDKLQLSAKIITHTCLTAKGTRGGCFDKDKCAGGFIEETLVGGIVWESWDPAIATVDQNGLLTAHQSGNVMINAKSKDIPNVVADQVEITIVEGPVRLDIVFMYENLVRSWWIWDLGYGEGRAQEMGNTLLGLLNQNFTDYRISIATFAHHASYFGDSWCGWDPLNDCGINFTNWGPYEAYTPVIPFQPSGSPDTPANVVAAYQSLSPTCKVPPSYSNGVESTSLYTALMSAIDGGTLGGWRAETPGIRTEKIIIFLSIDPACGMGYRIACDVEPISGLRSDDVIYAAQAKNIHIFPIYGWSYSNLLPNQEFYWHKISSQTGGAFNYMPENGYYSELYQIIGQWLAIIAEFAP
jgi:hypothetical protein